MTVRKAILNNMINEILLKNYDDNKKINNDREFQKELAWTKNQIILAYLKDQEIYAKLTASEEETRGAFLRLNKQIAASHLYTETEKEANYLYELLKMGVDFDNLAAQVFTDSTLRSNGGYLGYFTWGDMDPAFEDAAFSLKVGEISPPVKTAQGYSIIKVNDIITNPIITEYQYQQKKSQIEGAIKINKKAPAERNYISNLVNIDEIKFNEEILEKVLGALTGLQSNEDNQTALFDEVCAEYNNTEFNYFYVANKISILPKDYMFEINSIANLKAVIAGFIIQDELLKIAYEKDYDKNERVNETFSKMRDNLFFEFKKDEVFNKATVTDNEVLEFYYKNIYMFTNESEINVQEILVEDKSLADSLLEELKGGKKFDELARRFSIREWSAKNGGEMGYAPVSQYGMLKERFWNEPVGNLIGPLEVEGLYGLFKILGKINGQPIDFNLVKNEAEKLLKEERGKEIFQDYIEKLKYKTEVKINEKTLFSSAVAVVE
jgi:parvulin-like peptidyl-prolyl isomerase